jgi:hypothetical protein
MNYGLQESISYVELYRVQETAERGLFLSDTLSKLLLNAKRRRMQMKGERQSHNIRQAFPLVGPLKNVTNTRHANQKIPE